MRKGIIFVSIILVIIVTFSFLHLINSNQVVVGSLIKAVPLDAAFIIDISDYHAFREALTSNKGCDSEFLKIPVLKDLRFDLALMDSVTKINGTARQLISQAHPILVSGHPYRKDDIQCLYYFRVTSSGEFESIDQMIKNSHGIIIGSSRTYENSTIQDIVLQGTKNEGFSYVWTNGIFIISRSSILLENSIRQLAIKENILDHRGLGEIVKTAGKTSFMNIFLNFEQIPRLTSSWIHVKFKNEISIIKNIGNWAELDLNIKPDMVILNGFSSTNENTPGFESLFKNQKPVKFEAFSKIPATTSTFVLIGLSNFDQYVKDYQQLLEPKEFKTARSELSRNYSLDLISCFQKVFDHEAGIVYDGSTADTFENNAFSLIRVKSREETESMLTNLIANYVEKNNLKSSDLITTSGKEAASEQKIYNLPFGNVPALVFGKLFAGCENHYCTLSDNYLIFGRTKEAVTNYLNLLATGLFISNNLEFNDLSESFSSQSNFFFFHAPINSMGFYNTFFKRDRVAEITSNINNFNSLRVLIYQFNQGDNGFIYNNMFFKFKSTVKQIKQVKSATTLETTLDDALVGKPVFIKTNHDAEDEVLVQDRKNQLYLLNGHGTVSWKVKLAEPILSDVYPIDYYRNGKTQLLFNTSSKIYLIDRKGNTVDKFPVVLKSFATNGMAVFDYEKKKDYRLLVATADRLILCLDKKGEPVDGWACEPTVSKVTQPVQYFRIENKDLLAFSDQSRIYIVDRKGKPTLLHTYPFPVSPMNKLVLVNSHSLKDAKLVITDTTGKVIYTGLDGSVKMVDVGVFPGNHWFDMVDIDNDGIKEFIFGWNHTVQVMSQKGKELFTITLDGDMSYRPAFYEIKAHQFAIGVVCGSAGIIDLYQANGKQYRGFPLKGNTQFSLKHVNNSENRFNLIVGSDPNFLYDYSVELEKDHQMNKTSMSSVK